MLVNLHIVNLALIDELDIDFNEGLCILTGETGAGKSIIVGSIGIGLGGKYDSNLLRDKDKDGLVELLFNVDEKLSQELSDEDIEITDGELLISRRLSKGRTVNRINGSTVTVSKLKQVAERLMNLHAQHEQRTLMVASKHLTIVDSYDAGIKSCLEEVKAAYQEYKDIDTKLASMQLDEAERAKQLDYISYEINEIEAAKLIPGEDDELEELFRKASNSHDIMEIMSEVHDITGYDSDRSAGSQISRAVQSIQSLSRFDDNAGDMIDQLSDIENLINDFNRNVSEYISDMEFSDDELLRTESRLNVINGLKAKYGKTIEEIQSNLEELKKQKEELESYDDVIAELKVRSEEAYKKLEKLCDKLSDRRKKAAKKLCAAIADSLKELNFSKVEFDMKFSECEIGPNGRDTAEFMISTNVGEEVKPLASVASGGELSRVMLAIKSCLADTDDTPTIVFDEIDVGISGITAQKVGDMMKKLAKYHQIISITHLPQIAACADNAYVIEKEVVGGKTITGIRQLDDEGRVLELARLLGGSNITDAVLSTAREMLEN